jgi:hypothetical protein
VHASTRVYRRTAHSIPVQFDVSDEHQARAGAELRDSFGTEFSSTEHLTPDILVLTLYPGGMSRAEK